ncbi:hypothetical protein D9M72_333860 [compost metagenome]
MRTGIGDAADEFHELGRADDGVGDAGGLYQFFLRDLGAEVAVFGRPVGADDGQRDMVLNARSGLRRVKVAAGSLEEFQHRLVFKRRGIGKVDHHLSAGEGLLEPLASDAVDTAPGRGGHDLVAALAQNGDGLRADQAGPANDDNLHDASPC